MIKKIIYNNRFIAKRFPSFDRLWTQDEEFDSRWELRNKVIASHITIPGVVVDFGCGKMLLEKHLKDEHTYLPIDLHRRDARTLLFDVNKDSFPAINGETAVCSGFLEYVKNIDQFVSDLTSCAFKMIIISYCTTERFPDRVNRKGLNWENHLSVFEIMNLFLTTYNLSAIDDVNSNSIFVWTLK